MPFQLNRVLRRGRHVGRIRPGGKAAMFLPLFRPVLRRRRISTVTNEQIIPFSLTSGDLEVRLARNSAEIEAAQRLRYRIFFEEMSAQPAPEVAAQKRDFDIFDDYCEHLLVIDRSRSEGAEGVVGTYRLLRRQGAARAGRFYTQGEYNIRKLLQGRQEVLELGRSCVAPDHRRHQTMQLLWRGIAQYIQLRDVAVMFGCGSFPGADPALHAGPLSYLYHYHLAPVAIRPRALRTRYTDMRLLPREAVDERAAVAALPPLIKGYLRLGGFVGDGAVIDTEFDTTDVCIVVKTEWVTHKYMRRYHRDDAAVRRAAGPT